jgi:hypothetical protein
LWLLPEFLHLGSKL